MFRKFYTSHKVLILMLAGGILITSFALIAWRLFLAAQAPAEDLVEPVRVEYCGAELEELCVLSFGRDGDGNTIINFFVPEKKFPAFYLIVGRVTGESRFECDKNEDVPTSVYCIGNSINLDERIEISLFSKKGDRLLARGKVTLTAILISVPPIETSENQQQPIPTALPVSETAEFEPSYPVETVESETQTSTPTGTASYPNYP